MDLHYRRLGGSGTPIVILHGLFGSSKNWISRGKALSSYGDVYALDLRNHGDSPHAESHSLDDLADDLEQWCGRHLTNPPIILGHSMGGAAAMAHALMKGEQVRALIAVDIAPRSYSLSHEAIFRALETDLKGFEFRRQIDAALSDLLPDPQVRQFLLMNAEKTRGGYRWKIDGGVLSRSTILEDLVKLPGRYSGPALFVMGERSSYWDPFDRDRIRDRFPSARIEVIPHAGHWLHATHPRAFDEIVGRFIRKIA